MADHNAGIARATYELDAKQAEQTLDRVKKNTLEYEAILKRVLGLSKSPLPGVGGAGAGGSVSPQAAASIQALTAAQARGVITAARFATEQQKTATEVQKTAAAEDKAALAALRLSQAQDKATKGGSGGGLSGISSAAGSLAKTVGFVTSAFVAFKAATASLGFLRLGAETADARKSLDALALSSHTTGAALLTSLRDAAQGTIRDSALIQSANRGILLTQGQITQKLPELIQIARAAAKSTGEDVGGLFDSLVKGISRGSPRLIDNANIVISESDAYATFAKQIGKTTDELTDQEKQTATLNAVLAKGADIVKTVGLDANSSAAQIDRAVTSVQNLAEALATKIAPFAGDVAQGVTNALTKGDVSPGATDAKDATQAKLIGRATSFEDYARRVAAVNNQLAQSLATNPIDAWLDKQFLGLEQVTPAQFAYAQSLIATGVPAAQALAQTQQLVDVSGAYTQALRNSTDTAVAHRAELTALAPKIFEVASLSDTNRTAVLGLLTAYASGNETLPGFKDALDSLIKSHAIASEAEHDEERETRRLARSFVDIVPAANAAASAIAGVAGAAASIPKHINDTSGFLTDDQLKPVEDAFAGHLKRQQDIADARFDLSFAKAKTNAAKIALLRTKEAGETDPIKRLQIERQIVDLQNTSAKSAQGVSSKGLSVDTRADLALLSDKQARLAEVNRLLREGHQTELATKQLKKEQADLEEQISSEIDKQNQARVDAALDTVRDAQARLKEQREAAGLERQLQSPRFSASQQETARLRLAEIQLEQQKRALDIGRETKAAGGSAALSTPLSGTPNAPLGTGTPLTPGVPLGPIAALASASPINLSLTINIDERGQATIIGAPSGVNLLDVLVRTAPGGA